MLKIGILVADGARARFLIHRPPEKLTPELGSRLVEHSDWINPEGDLPARELFSDRAGRTHGSPAGSAHGADDHRERHQLELARRFARLIVDKARRFAREQSLGRLVLAAEPQLLGLLRPEIERQPLSETQVLELAEDLSRRSLADIHAILGWRGLLPEASPPQAGVYHPRGQPPSTR